MEFEGTLTANFIIITATASGKYYKEKVTTRDEFKFIYRAEMVAYRKTVENVDSDLLSMQNLTANEIAEKYGTKYIKEIVYGAELDLVYTAKFTKDVDLELFEAKFEACLFGIACIDIEFSGTEGFSREDFSESFSARLTGMDIPIPTSPNFSEVKQFMQDFNSTYINNTPKSIEAINNEKNVLKKLSPIGFYLGSISENLDDDDTNGKFRELEDLSKDLSGILSSAIFLKEQLIVTRDRQKVLYPDPRDKALLFTPYNDAVESVLTGINAKIEECLKYQSLPLEEMLVRSAPQEYERNEAVLDGLLGKKFLPEDVTVGTTTFIDMHYSGFALVVDGAMKPWLSGAIRLAEIDDETKNYKVVASATRPEDLERLAFKNINFDESKVRIRAAHQVTSADAIGPLFKLGEWTNPSSVHATNLQQFEFLNIGSLPLEAKASYNVTGLGAGVWTTGQVGKIGSEAKKFEKFALRILKPGTKSRDNILNEYYSVEYKAKLENGDETPFCKDGVWCGEENSGISAIYVKIVNKSGKLPCDEFSPCHCELSICYKP